MGYENSPKYIYLTSLPLTYIAILPRISPSETLQQFLRDRQITPKALFEDLDKESTRKVLRSFLKHVTGIYIIINKVNGKIYVGSAVKGQIYIRFYKHIISGKGGSKLVFAAVKKYGLNHFAFLVQETLNVTEENNRELLARENHYLSLVKPEYNIAKFAGNTLGVQHTEETKARMKFNYSSERRERIGQLNKGLTLSQETREKLRQVALQRGPRTPEVKAKISANSTSAKTIYIFDHDRNFLKSCRTIDAAASYCGCNEKTIRRALFSQKIVLKQFYVSR